MDQVESILQRTIPAFYAGIAVNIGVGPNGSEVSVVPSADVELAVEENDVIPDEEIPWDYLGE